MADIVFPTKEMCDDVHERVKRAFKSYRLRYKGIARMNFMCCMGCASHNLVPIAKRNKRRSVVYYHLQDHQSFRRGYPLHIRYSGYNPFTKEGTATDEESNQVGRDVVECLTEQGLITKWSGSHHETIQVVGIDYAPKMWNK